MKVLFSFSSAFVICICRQTFQFNSCQYSHGGTTMYVHVHKILYLFRGTVVNYICSTCTYERKNVRQLQLLCMTRNGMKIRGLRGKSQQCLNGFELSPHYIATIHEFRSNSF